MIRRGSADVWCFWDLIFTPTLTLFKISSQLLEEKHSWQFQHRQPPPSPSQPLSSPPPDHRQVLIPLSGMLVHASSRLLTVGSLLLFSLNALLPQRLHPACNSRILFFLRAPRSLASPWLTVGNTYSLVHLILDSCSPRSRMETMRHSHLHSTFVRPRGAPHPSVTCPCPPLRTVVMTAVAGVLSKPKARNTLGVRVQRLGHRSWLWAARLATLC